VLVGEQHDDEDDQQDDDDGRRRDDDRRGSASQILIDRARLGSDLGKLIRVERPVIRPGSLRASSRTSRARLPADQ
jgi:hypothetical protein